MAHRKKRQKETETHTQKHKKNLTIIATQTKMITSSFNSLRNIRKNAAVYTIYGTNYLFWATKCWIILSRDCHRCL